MKDTKRVKEILARWHYLCQRMSDLRARPRLSEDELVLQLKEVCDLRVASDEFLGEFSEKMWSDLLMRGYLTTRTLRWVEENIPDFAEKAIQLRLVLEAEPEQTELEIPVSSFR